jgi:hypothetical protein
MVLVVVLMFMKVYFDRIIRNILLFFKGPQSIGTRIRSENYLVPGMILSDGLFHFYFIKINFLF